MPLRCSALLAQLREGALDLVSALVEPDGLDGVRLLDAELGIADLSIAVMAGNEDALRFYRRRGLVPVELVLWRVSG